MYLCRLRAFDWLLLSSIIEGALIISSFPSKNVGHGRPSGEASFTKNLTSFILDSRHRLVKLTLHLKKNIVLLKVVLAQIREGAVVTVHQNFILPPLHCFFVLFLPESSVIRKYRSFAVGRQDLTVVPGECIRQYPPPMLLYHLSIRLNSEVDHLISFSLCFIGGDVGVKV